MANAQITTEKLTDACKNGTCGHPHEFIVPINESKAKANISINEEKPMEIKTPEIREVEKIIEKVKVPSHIPKIKCKDCKGTHENPNYTKRPKFKCNNCSSLNPDAECLTCNKGEEFEEMSDEDLDELGIPSPKEREHVHESEE